MDTGRGFRAEMRVVLRGRRVLGVRVADPQEAQVAGISREKGVGEGEKKARKKAPAH